MLCARTFWTFVREFSAVGPECAIQVQTGALSGELVGICSAADGGRNPWLAQGHPQLPRHDIVA